MKRTFLVGMIGLACLAPLSAQAGWHEFWDRVHLDWHRSNAWPQPFSDVDKHLAQEPFKMMARNGWRMQNTLGSELFDLETQQLTRAGQLKVHWILTQTPVSRRTVFVLHGGTQRATEARMASVKRAVRNMHSVDVDPEAVVVTVGIPPRNGSGDYLDRVRRSYEASTPSPRLPKIEKSGGGN